MFCIILMRFMQSQTLRNHCMDGEAAVQAEEDGQPCHSSDHAQLHRAGSPKRLDHLPNTDPPRVRIISDNPLYSPYEGTAEEVNIIGRIRWFAREI
jgi:phage repressor protein C with HTH and peptisase S24 domain